MEKPIVMPMLKDTGALIQGHHFVYTSDRHGPDYIQFDRVFPHTEIVHNLAQMLVHPFLGYRVQTIAVPAIGGIVLGEAAALQFHRRNMSVKLIWAEKDETGNFQVTRPGFADHIPGKRVLVLDDVLNAGTSTGGVSRLVREYGDELVAVSVVVNRGGHDEASLNVPDLRSLLLMDVESYAPEECPLCQQKEPIVINMGHGLKFEKAHPRYRGRFKEI